MWDAARQQMAKGQMHGGGFRQGPETNPDGLVRALYAGRIRRQRRLLVATTTIAELYAILPMLFGWSAEHLHRFVIHGREYDISCGR